MKSAQSHPKRVGFALLTAAVLTGVGFETVRVSGQVLDASAVWQKSLTIGTETPMRANMTLIQRVPGKTLTYRAGVIQGTGGRYRVEYTAPNDLTGRVITSDGLDFRQFDPKQNTETQLAQVAGTGQGGRLTDPRIPQSHKIALLSDHEITAGRRAYLLEITPFRADLSRQKRWIDRETYKTLRVETRFPDGKLSRDITYNHVQLPAKTAPSDFQIAPRPGLRRLHSAPADMPLPANLLSARAAALGLLTDAPLGFRLMRATEEAIGGKRNSQFLYSNGIETISIFAQDGGAIPQTVPAGWQRLTLRGVPVFAQKTGHTNALVWQRGGHRFTAIARLAPAALQAFAVGLPL